jgi:hypothetical protein
MPQILWGKWVITRDLPTKTISCWGENEAKALIGTELEYSLEVFRWHTTVTKNPVTETRTITAERFHDENSGMGKMSSQVTFQQLGIKAAEAVEIAIHHPPSNITGGTIGIPGDGVLVKDQDTIIISACNVYFEARRSTAPGKK